MTSRTGDPLGKRALFSDQQEPAGSWTVTVHCSSCGESTSLTVAGFLMQHFPAWMWIPWRRYAHLMRCPACGKFAWHAAT